MLKVYIFNAALVAGSDKGLRTLIRGYFVCSQSERHYQAQLRDALTPWGLRLEDIEREQEISEELLSESLPHINAMYRLRGYGLELYGIKDRPEESMRSSVGVALAQRRLTSDNLLPNRLFRGESQACPKDNS